MTTLIQKKNYNKQLGRLGLTINPAKYDIYITQDCISLLEVEPIFKTHWNGDSLKQAIPVMNTVCTVINWLSPKFETPETVHYMRRERIRKFKKVDKANYEPDPFKREMVAKLRSIFGQKEEKAQQETSTNSQYEEIVSGGEQFRATRAEVQVVVHVGFKQLAFGTDKPYKLNNIPNLFCDPSKMNFQNVEGSPVTYLNEDGKNKDLICSETVENAIGIGTSDAWFAFNQSLERVAIQSGVATYEVLEKLRENWKQLGLGKKIGAKPKFLNPEQLWTLTNFLNFICNNVETLKEVKKDIILLTRFYNKPSVESAFAIKEGISGNIREDKAVKEVINLAKQGKHITDMQSMLCCMRVQGLIDELLESKDSMNIYIYDELCKL